MHRAYELPIFNQTLSRLRDHSQLRRLSLVIPNGTDRAIRAKNAGASWGRNHWTRFVDCNLNLSCAGFHSLESLQLFNVSYGKDTVFFAGLVSALVSSPKLRKFGISFHPNQEHEDFLLALSRAYAQAGGKTLSLNHLYLGEGCGSYTADSTGFLSDAVESQFTNRTTLQSVTPGCPDIRDIPDLPTATMRYLPEISQSLRRFSALFLDTKALRLIRMIGNDPTLPPLFMSQQSFSCCVYTADMCEYFKTNADKQAYWPKHFSIGKFSSGRSSPEDKRQIIRQLYKWTGLTRLHVSVDLKYKAERVSDNLCFEQMDSGNKSRSSPTIWRKLPRIT